jgi:hypothetical protein
MNNPVDDKEVLVELLPGQSKDQEWVKRKQVEIRLTKQFKDLCGRIQGLQRQIDELTRTKPPVTGPHRHRKPTESSEAGASRRDKFMQAHKQRKKQERDLKASLESVSDATAEYDSESVAPSMNDISDRSAPITKNVMLATATKKPSTVMLQFGDARQRSSTQDSQLESVDGVVNEYYQQEQDEKQSAFRRAVVAAVTGCVCLIGLAVIFGMVVTGAIGAAVVVAYPTPS